MRSWWAFAHRYGPRLASRHHKGLDLCFRQLLLKCVICLDTSFGPLLRARSWCWPGRGGAVATAVVPAITTPNAGWRQDNRSVAVIAFFRLSSGIVPLS